MSIATHSMHRGCLQLLHAPNIPVNAMDCTTLTVFSQCAHRTLLVGETR